MVKKGDVIENPITGERMEFLQTAEDTEGGLLQLMLTVRPNGFVAAPHIHPVQEERFMVKSGTLRLRVGDEECLLTGGQTGLVTRGMPHVWWNGGADELIALVEFRPALQIEDIFSSLFALARAGKTNKMGLPNLIQIAVTIRKHQHEIYLAKPSITVQKILFRSIASIGLLLGYQADVPYQPVPPSKSSLPDDAELATVPIKSKYWP
jgi:mannose-6-phosphate isomerase-like protein (cupin superfamily)